MEYNPLGNRIRSLRRHRGMRLQDVADACGFTKSLLSKIENGRSSPPMATAATIARALGVPLSALLAEVGPARRVERTRAAETAPKPTDKGYAFAALAAGRGDKLMQPFLFSARRGEVRRQPLTHPGEEFVYVLTGSLRYRVGDVEHILEAGDSLYFDSHEEHDFDVVGAAATWLAVFLDRAEAAQPRTSAAKARPAPRSTRRKATP